MSVDFYKQNYNGSKIEKPDAQELHASLAGATNVPPVPSIEEVETITADFNQETQAAQEQIQEEAPQSINQSQPEVESAQAKNFRQLREAKEKAEREKYELEARLKAYEAAHQGQPQEDFDFEVEESDLVEGKHLKKYVTEVRKLQRELQQQKQQTSVVDQRTRLRNNYSDFDKVVNGETIELLSTRFPELAHTLNSSNDLYSTGVSAYTMIKQLGIYKEDTFESDRQRIQQNAAKPKPLASLSPQKSESPLSNANSFANGLTDDLKKNLWKEMQELRRKN